MGTQNPVITREGAVRAITFSNSIVLNASGAVQLLAAASGSNVYRDITFLQASNTSATGVRVDISDGTITYSWYLAPSGGGFNISFNPPLVATNQATPWTANISASVTDVRVSAQCVELTN